VEELTIWLIDCHTLLTAKDRDSIPDDLTVVEALLDEHTVHTGANHCLSSAPAECYSNNIIRGGIATTIHGWISFTSYH